MRETKWSDTCEQMKAILLQKVKLDEPLWQYATPAQAIDAFLAEMSRLRKEVK